MLTVSAGASHIPPIEAGSYPALCYGLIDLGEQFNERYEKWSRKVLLMWEIPELTLDLGDGEVSRTISQKYTASLNDRAALRKDLAAWRGRDFTDEELKRFDLRTIVGAPCMLSIIHKESNGNTYANISAIMKLPKQIPVPEGRLESIVVDLDRPEDLKKLDLLPDWIANQVKESKQYKELTGAMPPPPESMDDLDLPTEPDDEVPF